MAKMDYEGNCLFGITAFEYVATMYCETLVAIAKAEGK